MVGARRDLRVPAWDIDFGRGPRELVLANGFDLPPDHQFDAAADLRPDAATLILLLRRIVDVALGMGQRRSNTSAQNANEPVDSIRISAAEASPCRNVREDEVETVRHRQPLDAG